MYKIYRYDITTKEFIQELEINEAYGSNLPFTTTVKPLAKKEGFAVIFNDTKWEYVEDNRGKTIYVKATKQELKVDYLGKIKDEHTLLIPSQFDEWNGTLWETDIVLQNEFLLKKAKAEGETYTLNGVDYQVPFMKDDADGVLTISYNFDRNVYENTVIYFSNGTKLPIAKIEFNDFCNWFMSKRNSFFVG